MCIDDDGNRKKEQNIKYIQFGGPSPTTEL